VTESSPDGYVYTTAADSHTHDYLWKPVLSELANLRSATTSRRLFDLGCGNGSTAAALTAAGFEVTGVDPSTNGIQIANREYPNIRLDVGSCYDDLAAKYGTFPALISLEVVEHVFLPRKFAKCVFDLLEPGGTAVISTPYHGYLKNLAIALTGKMDAHFTALWDYGHIKFWSRTTLRSLLEEAGLRVARFIRVGRIPAFAKSMVVVADRPR